MKYFVVKFHMLNIQNWYCFFEANKKNYFDMFFSFLSFKDMAELKLCENKVHDFSRLLKYTSGSKVKSPSRDVEMVSGHSRGNTLEDRSRRNRKILQENHGKSDIFC